MILGDRFQCVSKNHWKSPFIREQCSHSYRAIKRRCRKVHDHSMGSKYDKQINNLGTSRFRWSRWNPTDEWQAPSWMWECCKHAKSGEVWVDVNFDEQRFFENYDQRAEMVNWLGKSYLQIITFITLSFWRSHWIAGRFFPFDKVCEQQRENCRLII